MESFEPYICGRDTMRETVLIGVDTQKTNTSSGSTEGWLQKSETNSGFDYDVTFEQKCMIDELMQSVCWILFPLPHEK